MSVSMRKGSNSIGLPPGSLIHIGRKTSETIGIQVIDYTKETVQEMNLDRIEECFQFKDTDSVTWINIEGIHDPSIIQSIGTQFNIHPLVLEDIMNTNQRPKMEIFDDYIYLVFKMLYQQKKEEKIESEQVSILIMKHAVISFQERHGDIFDPIRERIRSGTGRIRKMGTDYLAYSLFDAVVDHYFTILENIGESIEVVEDELLDNPKPETLHRIHSFKSDMIFLRKSVWPLREVVSSLLRGESPLITKATGIFLRDVYDHTIQVIDTVETFRDMISGMFDIYMSSVSNKMNEVMKVLTIFAAIFIPLTFVAGIYGMNFDTDISPFNMPELTWYLGYPFSLFIMLAISVTMIWFFKRKKWL